MKKDIYALIVKEFLAVWQDKRVRLLLILPPLIQLFIFAFAATLDVKNVSIAVLNRDYGKLSYELVERFSGSPYFTHVKMLDKASQIQDEIDKQKSTMVIHIDETFSRNLLMGKPAQVQLILDGRKSNGSQIVQGYAFKIIAQYNEDLSKDLGLPTPPQILVPRNWFNPNLIFSWFTIPGIVAILTMSTCLLVTAMTIAREREMGTFDQLLVSPLSEWDILIGKAVPGIVIGMGEGTIILLAAIFSFKIPFTGSLFFLYFSMFIFVTAIIGMGLFLSSLCKTQQQALLAVFVCMVTIIILSGFASPIENMPKWLQYVTVINPLRFFLVIVRGIFLKDLPFKYIVENLYPIGILAVFNLVFSSWFFKKRLE